MISSLYDTACMFLGSCWMLRAITNVHRALTVYRLGELALTTRSALETLPATFEPDGTAPDIFENFEKS